MQIIQDTLAGLQIGEPVVHRQMAMFPLLGKQAGGGERAYLTLDEALGAAWAEVGEVSEGGSVPELLFKNPGDKPVLLVEGEELVGAKQNRTLNVSILAPPKKETLIPVSCVERGRWGYDDGEVFQSSDRAHYAMGRRAKREAVNRNMSRDPQSRHADQGAVWAEIDAKMATMAARSDTDAMADIYEQHRGSLDDYVGAFEQQPRQVGAVFVVGTRFAGVDLFAHEETFGVLLPKLLRSYALDALELRAGKPIEPRGFRGAAGGRCRRRAGPEVSGGRDGRGRAHREPGRCRRGAGGGRRRAAPGGVPSRRATRRRGRRRIPARQPATREPLAAGVTCGLPD